MMNVFCFFLTIIQVEKSAVVFRSHRCVSINFILY